MEIKARYLLMGLFTLAAITAGFAFVYWLETTGGLGKRTTYEVRFQSPVSGLLPGSAVLFNGIRVGEVTGLRLVPDKPREVDATIAVDAGTPVRADTQVSLEFQGLTGVPAVTLVGGSPGAPAVNAAGGMPLLIASETAGQSMSEAARQVLGRLDKILDENSTDLHSMISNLTSFSQALGRNADKVDSVLSGLEKMTGGGKSGGPIYDLSALAASSLTLKPFGKQVSVPDPTALLSLDADKILVQNEDGTVIQLADGKWSDTLPKVVQAKIVQSFENNGALSEVNRTVEGATPDYQLLTEIRRFQVNAGPSPSADAQISAKIATGDGQIIAAKIFTAKEPAKSASAADASAALDRALGAVLTQLLPWAADAVAGTGEKAEPSTQLPAKPRKRA
jgi:phospholipid/cholesterol/gamma-HCH transport system substrate-binding protein